MKYTFEQIEAAKAAKSVEELLALAKENGVSMTGEEAKTVFDRLHQEGELSDEELENVAGGKNPSPKFSNGYKVQFSDDWFGTRVGTIEYAICYQGKEDGWLYQITLEDGRPVQCNLEAAKVNAFYVS